MAKFNRILLKLSGESLMGEKKYGIDEKRLAEYAAQSGGRDEPSIGFISFVRIRRGTV